MEDKKEYFKANRKSKKPATVRYDLGQFEIAKKRSGKPTIQALFDFLLDAYVRDVAVSLSSNSQNVVPQRVSSNLEIDNEPSWQNYKFFASRIKNIDSQEEAIEFILDIEASDNLTAAEVAKLKELLKIKSGG